ncbi:MAG: universal stress protein [Candidatus Cyclobacteriaceae bacterium M2_1C_046]
MNIIVPTDFSACAENAGLYAADLAKSTDSKLFFIHVVTHFTDEEVYLPIDLATIKEEKQERMIKLVNLIKKKHTISCEGNVDIGDVTLKVFEHTAEKKGDFILLGTHGSRGLSKIFGSTTTAIIEDSAYPVIAIPENASFERPENIVYATDYEVSDLKALKQLTEVASLFNAKIQVLHVIEKDGDPVTEHSIVDYFSYLVKKNIEYPNISFHVNKNENVEKGIESFSNKTGANIIALATRKHNLISKLFNRSVAKELSYNSKIPLIAFHINEEERVNTTL